MQGLVTCVRGFEPPTPWSVAKCSIQLSYTHTLETISKRYVTLTDRSCQEKTVQRVARYDIIRDWINTLIQEVFEMAAKVTADMPIVDILALDDSIQYVLMGSGMFCFSCGSAIYESVGEAAMVHGIDPAGLVKKLNDYLEFKEETEKMYAEEADEEEAARKASEAAYEKLLEHNEQRDAAEGNEQ